MGEEPQGPQGLCRCCFLCWVTSPCACDSLWALVLVSPHLFPPWPSSPSVFPRLLGLSCLLLLPCPVDPTVQLVCPLTHLPGPSDRVSSEGQDGVCLAHILTSGSSRGTGISVTSSVKGRAWWLLMTGQGDPETASMGLWVVSSIPTDRWPRCGSSQPTASPSVSGRATRPGSGRTHSAQSPSALLRVQWDPGQPSSQEDVLRSAVQGGAMAPQAQLHPSGTSSVSRSKPCPSQVPDCSLG